MELSIISIERLSKFRTFQHIYTDFIFHCGKFVTKSYCCNRIWLKNRNWLKYSPSKYTLFWLPRLVFGNVKKLNLASTSLKYWISALNPKLEDHRNKQYKEAVEKCHDFVKTMKDPSRGIDAKMNRFEARQIEEIRSRVRIFDKMFRGSWKTQHRLTCPIWKY